jgi:hypothetical protein
VSENSIQSGERASALGNGGGAAEGGRALSIFLTFHMLPKRDWNLLSIGFYKDVAPAALPGERSKCV